MFKKGNQFGKLHLGKKLSEEHKKHLKECHKGSKGKHWRVKNTSKMSESHKGNIPWNKGKKGLINNGGFEKGHKSGMTGKHHSEATRKKMSENRPNIYGEKSSQWKGGITPGNKKIRNSIEFRLWREAVFARDNWTCQKYHIRGYKLHSHHIRNFAQYPELRFAIDNGITLSEKAHNEFHKIYGKKNNTREQLDEFLKIKFD